MLVDLIAKNYKINYKVITEELLNKVTGLFSSMAKEAKSELPDHLTEILYEIRVGNETYSGPSFDEFSKQYKKHYKADFIQIIFQAIPQKEENRIDRKITMTIDKIENNTLQVLGINATWVNGAFNRYKETLDKEPNRNVIIHNAYFEMCIQLLVVLALTTFSIYSSEKITTSMNIQYSSVYVFIVIFLLLSNVWTYASKGLLYIRNTYYPKVDILKHARKPLLISITIFIAISIASWAIGYIMSLIFVK